MNTSPDLSSYCWSSTCQGRSTSQSPCAHGMEARSEALEDLGDAVTPLEVPHCKLSTIHLAKIETG